MSKQLVKKTEIKGKKALIKEFFSFSSYICFYSVKFASNLKIISNVEQSTVWAVLAVPMQNKCFWNTSFLANGAR